MESEGAILNSGKRCERSKEETKEFREKEGATAVGGGGAATLVDGMFMAKEAPSIKLDKAELECIA